MKKIIGITGGIASGKSNVCKLIKEVGYEIIDSDLVYRNLCKKNGSCYNAIVSVFGKEYLNSSLEIDRKKLGKLIYYNETARMKLNNITHPLILQEIQKQIEKSTNNIIFIDVPLLYEAKYDFLCDKIICVYLPKDMQIKRLMERDNIDYDYALSKINSQMDLEEKKKIADYVINSCGTFEETKQIVYNLLKEIKGDI